MKTKENERPRRRILIASIKAVMLKGNLEKNKNWTWAIENTSSKAIMGYTYLKKSQRLREKYFFEKLIMHQPIMNER